MDVFTAFRPSTHGFGFANDFPSVPAKTIDLVVTQVPLGNASNGLCGGMVYGALDYFLAKRPPPTATEAPGSGPLFDYLVDRLLDSWRAEGLHDLPAGVTYFQLMGSTVPDEERWWTRFSPWRSRAYVMAKLAWPAVQADVDAGLPSPLGLVRKLSWDPRDLGQHHQVLVWGYRVEGRAVTLLVYDPNRAGDDGVALHLDVGRLNRKIMVTRTPPSNHPIHCFFRPAYAVKTPPPAP